jgi:hypothetical protein
LMILLVIGDSGAAGSHLIDGESIFYVY